MRPKRIIPLCLALVLCVGVLCVPASAILLEKSPTGSTSCTIDTPYSYPIVPGTDEWNELDSLSAKIDACRVDEKLLESMTTPALLETVINYPLLANIYAFSTLEEGIKSVSEYFSGLPLLLSRKDAAEHIQSCLAVGSSAQSNTEAIFRENCLESLADYMSASQVAPAASTPGGSTLKSYYDLTWRDHKTTKAKAQANHDKLKALYPKAIEVSGINPSYNCHSYAWHDTSTSNNCWIDDPNPYMSDGSYSKVSSASRGAKVCWSGAIHSAIVKSISGGAVTYISKWGYNGVFIHSKKDCPYSGTVTYWT